MTVLILFKVLHGNNFKESTHERIKETLPTLIFLKRLTFKCSTLAKIMDH